MGPERVILDRRNGNFNLSNVLGYGFVVLSVGVFGTIGFGLSGGLGPEFIAGLSSRLAANYGRDSIPLRLKTLGLSIFGDFLSDQATTLGDSGALATELSNPVPTVTPLGGVEDTPTPDLTATSEAEAQFATLTATWAVTDTTTPTSTPTQAATTTSTPTPTPTATATPTATKTLLPTKTSGPTGSCGKELCPVLVCVDYASCEGCVESQYVAYYDYENVTDSVIEIPVGDLNHFYPAPEDRQADNQPDQQSCALEVRQKLREQRRPLDVSCPEEVPSTSQGLRENGWQVGTSH